MLRKLFLICTALIAFMAMSTAALADEWLKSIPDFDLTDQLGASHTLDKYADKDFVVFYVQGVGCPIARIALPNYREVRDEFAAKNIEFVMFNSNIQDNPQRIAKEAAEFGIDFPIMKDEGQVLAKALGVERTAEVFIVNPRTKEVLYRGPINDQLGYETQKVSASEHYLKDALNTVIAGGTVDMDEVPDSKGCLVAIFDT
ncbi:MAG: redoxin family protein [Gammaproteobacteria bacterium]|jgi:peroxiredoxin|nr:redoxin family protein [Gammaproteobacteria bacterium]MBT3860255.1 redoxin family protein [Gammaproteobacteria bacterium]MBT3987547.1 redoxin family protein [Gammaproteobacteria bacterium]MBT4581715.1 redoxin family protein [Gammaproteobacteria bacterium]MBT4659575.1 redoxin family protein [Gammaproteobacteria bacterium]